MRRGAAMLVAVAIVASLPVPARAAQPAQERAWLALGDSYSSGEGIDGTPAAYSNFLQQDCRRATGEGTSATAWAAGAYQQVHEELGLRRMSFVACTGNITDDAPVQAIEAAQAAGNREQWDLASFSFGGNNIRFADVIIGCLKPEKKSWRKFDVGCKDTEDQLRRRIDMLVGNTDIDPAEYRGSVALPRLFDLVARRVVSGGDVVVTGYPNLFEEVDRWPGWVRKLGVCQGILARDVPLLRSVAGYLNQQLARAVVKADQEYRGKGIRFHFVDIAADPYESGADPENRHGLCSDDPWLNGIQVDAHQPGKWGYKNRSFHPNQKGHTATAKVIADFVRGHVRFDDGPTEVTEVPADPYRQGSFYFFTSADKRYSCGIAAEVALCQGETQPVPPRPESCPEGGPNWGYGMSVDDAGKPDFVCAGGLIYGPLDRQPDERDVLRPDTAITAFDFRCAAVNDGVRCTHSPTGHGFYIAARTNDRF